MKNNITIPAALQIRVDDVGWFIGDDERYKGYPSRTGIPRLHHPDDYIVLNELGKALDMKLGCAFVIGEWDKNNRLRGVPHVTYDSKNWDRASKIDCKCAEKCFENIENSEYLNITYHGLMHGYYDGNLQVTERQFYPLEYDAANGCYKKNHVHLPLDEFRRHLDLFFEIYNDWGFTKKINTFSAPNGAVGVPSENADYAKILRDEYGIIYWPNAWTHFTDNTDVVEGVICYKGKTVTPWNTYDVTPKNLSFLVNEDTEVPLADAGYHWPNFLRYNPENNMERLPEWIDYFHRQAEVFGAMLSKDTAFAASQIVYNRFAKLDITDNTCIIDLSEVDSKQAVGLRNEFFISIRNGVIPESCIGAGIELYETKQQFRTYKITRANTQNVKLTLKNG